MSCYASTATLSVVTLNDLLGESSEITLLINQLPEVGLREYSQGVSGNLSAFAWCSTLDKVRYCSELALGNDLQSFTSLKSKTVLRDVDLGHLA
mgnify:CR=1 FL=1